MCFFKSLRSLLNFWQISSHGNSISDFLILSTLIYWWKVIDSLPWKPSIFNSKSEQLPHVKYTHSVDWVLHEKSSINDCTLFASAISADEAILFDNSSIFSQVSHKHEDCGMSLLNTSSNSKTLLLHDWNAMVSFTKPQ